MGPPRRGRRAATSRPTTSSRATRRSRSRTCKTAVKEASELLLATDPDREGESISWHLAQVLKPKVPVRRIVFHEITEDAVKEALDAPRQTSTRTSFGPRRAAASSIGSTATRSSPVLWKKVQTGLSAGRVQSVAVRLIVEREEERRAFRSGGLLGPRGDARRRGTRVHRHARSQSAISASPRGKDFDAADRRAQEPERAPARRGRRRGRWSRPIRANVPWTVTAVEQKPGVERPAPPFTTSTLTQEASRKLGFSTERTMQVAQRLFQGVEQSATARWKASSPTTAPTRRRCRTRRSNESARVIREMFGGGILRRAAPLSDAREERAGSARSDPSHRLPPGAEPARRRARRRRAEGLRADLEADDGVADGGRARAADDDRDLGARARTARRPCFTASGKAIEFAGFRRAYVEGSDDPGRGARGAGNDPAAVQGRRSRSTRDGSDRRSRCRHGAEAPRDVAAGALHRGVAHQGARAARHRPSVHLRADDRDHRPPRLRVPAGRRRSCRASPRSR